MMKDAHSVGVDLAREADARRSEFERERQVPADLFRRAGEAGLFRQLICAELGGLGRSAVEWFRTGVEMARWEPSFSWVVTQGRAIPQVSPQPVIQRSCRLTWPTAMPIRRHPRTGPAR